MNTVLLTAGVVALLAAVIGGGLKAFDVEMPVLKSSGVRVSLGVLGIAFVGGAVMLRENSSSEAGEARYQRQVTATCNAVRRLSSRDVLGQPLRYDEAKDGFTFDRDAMLARSRAILDGRERRINLLLAKPAPDSLRSRAEAVRRQLDSYVRKTRSGLEELRSALPSSFTLRELEAAGLPYEAQSDEVAARLEDAMTRLADRECALSSGS